MMSSFCVHKLTFRKQNWIYYYHHLLLFPLFIFTTSQTNKSHEIFNWTKDEMNSDRKRWHRWDGYYCLIMNEMTPSSPHRTPTFDCVGVGKSKGERRRRKRRVGVPELWIMYEWTQPIQVWFNPLFSWCSHVGKTKRERSKRFLAIDLYYQNALGGWSVGIYGLALTARTSFPKKNFPHRENSDRFSTPDAIPNANFKFFRKLVPDFLSYLTDFFLYFHPCLGKFTPRKSTLG